jgi:AraC family transcriptional regulator
MTPHRVHAQSVSTVLLYDRATRQPLTPGPATVEHSSYRLPWQSFVVERHRLEPVERPPGISTHYMLGVLRGGPARVEIFDGQSSGKRYAKRPGAVTLTAVGPVPHLIYLDGARLIVSAFAKPFMEDVAAESDQALPEMDGTVTVRDPAIVRLSVLLDEEAASGGPGGVLYAESLARSLALRFLLWSRPDAASAGSVNKPCGSLPPARLNRVLDAMQAGIEESPSLRELADASGYSPHHFGRMFRAATGATPHEYLLQLRVARARELLRQRSRSLAEIAFSTGFASQAHFTTVFRRFTGATPAAWRRDHIGAAL